MAGIEANLIVAGIPLPVSPGGALAVCLANGDIEGVACVFWFLIAILVGIYILSRVSRSQNQSLAYQKLANFFHGRYHVRRSVGGWPRATFRHRGVIVIVDYLHGWTRVVLPWNQPGFLCRVEPRGIFASFQPDAVRLHNRHFDATFSIQGKDSVRIREFLSTSLQTQIYKIRSFLGRTPFQVIVTGKSFIVKKRGRLNDYGRLKRFVDLALNLHDRASSSQLAGPDEVRIVPGQSAASADPPKCQVCGEPITEDMVFCRSCETPHHRECWDYTGRCSIYGCSQTRYYTASETRFPIPEPGDDS